MSIEKTESVVKDFLQNTNPEVLAIKGSWGVGKTFFWNKLIKDIDKEKCSFEQYAYVSLFGIKSLDDLKFAILTKVVDKSIAGKALSLEDLINETKKRWNPTKAKAKGLFFGKISPVLNKLFGKYSEAYQEFAFAYLEDTLICIDDFERKGIDLEPRDVLGLLLNLKEQRNCKIAMIFNDIALSENDKKEYAKLREKVVDIEINFSPTLLEVNSIVFNDGLDINEKIKFRTNSLEINNIRILKKIKDLSGKVYELIKNDVEEEVIENAITTIVLFTWCFYVKGEEVPDYEFVKNSRFDYFVTSKDKPEREQNWDSIIRNYGYTNTDEFDLALANAIEVGYLDEELLKEKARLLNQSVIAQQGEASFRAAWDLFHNSFKDNEDELAIKLKESLEANATYLSTNDLDATVRLLREMTKNEDADILIETYIEKNKNNIKRFDLNRFEPLFAIKDEEILKKFAQFVNENKENPGAEDILKRISEIDGWSNLDIQVLASTSEEEFYEIFINQDGKHLPRYVKKCLDFRNYGDADNNFKTIVKNATKALKKIGKTSRLNKIRVERFGIKLDDD